MARLDFEKASNTVEHQRLWKILGEQGVERHYINMLKELCRREFATASAGVGSREFSIKRGVRQGDPISSLLFVSVMESIFRGLKCRWHGLNKRRTGTYYGIVIDNPEEPLTNLRFADDVILIAACQRDLRNMITDLELHAAKFGLKIHMAKTSVLTNSVAKRPPVMKCGSADVKVIPHGGSAKYLGRLLSAERAHQTEVAHRISAGWAAFFRLKAFFRTVQS